MRLPVTLSVYALRETLYYAAIGLVGVGAVLLSQNVLGRMDELREVGANGTEILRVIGHLIVIVASFSIPIAVLFGTLVAMGRFSSDGEILAMRSLGLSLTQLMIPFVTLGLVVCALSGLLLIESAPAARRGLRSLSGEILGRGGVIQPLTFNRLDGKGDRLIFVDEREGQDLTRVMISDRTNPALPFTVTAETGRFSLDEQTEIIQLDLQRGDIQFEPSDSDDPDYRRIGFERFAYRFDTGGVFGANFSRILPAEMSLGELTSILEYFSLRGQPPPAVRERRGWRYEVELQRRVALSFAPLMFALVGVPLGLRRSRGARSWGALGCVVLVFGYYMVLSLGVYLAEHRYVPPTPALWIPNLVFAFMAVWLLRRAR